MKKDMDEFDLGSRVWPEEIKVAENENGFPEVWVSDQFFPRFQPFIATRGIPIGEVKVGMDGKGIFFDTELINIPRRIPKGTLVDVVRGFLESEELDWYEPFHEDSEPFYHEFVIPGPSMRKSRR